MTWCRASLALLVVVGGIILGDGVGAGMRGDPCDISGVVVDESEQPVQGVRLEVIVTELEGLLPVRWSTNLAINGRFTFQSLVAAEVTLIARRDGYSVGTAYLNRGQLNAKDIVIQLVSAPAGTRLVEVHEAQMRLNLDGSGIGLLLASGEMVPVDSSPDMYLALPTDWSEGVAALPGGVRLCIASPGGVQRVAGARGTHGDVTLSAVVEAPAEGYTSEVQIDLRDHRRQIFCFQTPAGLYGKIDLGTVETFHDRRQIWALARYYFQPDGSRNLNNRSRLKLLRAKNRPPSEAEEGSVLYH